MRATDGEELGPLLDEQRAYYRALAADYLDQGLDLPGGNEVTEALDAFHHAGAAVGLIDQYTIVVHPAVLGTGKHLFGGLRQELPLQLVATKEFAAGCVVLRYQPTSR